MSAVNGNVLTLSNPWTNSYAPSNTPVVRRGAGSTFNYEIWQNGPANWTYCTVPLLPARVGAVTMWDAVLLNYDGLPSAQSFVTGVEAWEGAPTNRPVLFVSTDHGATYTSNTAARST